MFFYFLVFITVYILFYYSHLLSFYLVTERTQTGTEEQTEEVFLRMQSFLDKCLYDPPLYKPMKACECSLRGVS